MPKIGEGEPFDRQTDHEMAAPVAKARKTRSDAGKQKSKGNAGSALVDVIKALQDLSVDDKIRVLEASAKFSGISIEVVDQPT